MSGNEMALESVAEVKLSDLVDSKLLKFCKYINKVRDQIRKINIGNFVGNDY